MTRPSDMPPAERWGHGTRARYTSGCHCAKCRAANTAYQRSREAAIKAGLGNPLVRADAAREHLHYLSSIGIGRRAVHAQTGINRSTLMYVKNGRKTQIRKQTALKILAVTSQAKAPGALVPAGETWQRIAYLLRRGWTKVAIARALGQRGQGLQLRRVRITARHYAKIRLLYLTERLKDYVPPPILWRHHG